MVIVPNGSGDHVLNLNVGTNPPTQSTPINFQDDGEQTYEDFDGEAQRKPNFEKKNLDKLREMQERREREKKMIEEERAKVRRRQEKMKNKILKEA